MYLCSPFAPHPRPFLSLLLAACLLTITRAQIPFSIGGPGVNPNDFRKTTFATGLNYPVGMVELSDRSILVAESNGASFFGSTSGSLVRYADTNQDGVSDVRQVLVNNVAGGGLSSLRKAGNLFFTTGQGSGKPISIYRGGATPADPLTLAGTITLTYPGGGWLHPHSALAARPTPGQPNQVDLFFQVGSQVNFGVTTSTVAMTSNFGAAGALAGDAIHRLTITDNGGSIAASTPQQIATGLRNSAGMAFHPLTGDLYLEDNGIDGFINNQEPESADELNRIAVGDVGGAIEDFGFPQNYIQYRTGTFIGGGDIPPLAAIQPIPDPMTGSEAEGPNDIAFAPLGFPAALRNGVFMGMHGKFSAGGLANEENPLVFINLEDNSYFHFVGNNEASVGHLDGLISTQDSLFIADITTRGDFTNASANRGAIYQIQYVPPSLPGEFNGDGIYDCVDINELADAVAQASTNTLYDLNSDGQVDIGDLDRWRSIAGEANIGSGRSYLSGDANLDAVVDGSDFNLWNSHKFTSDTAWCSGNFNGDAVIDGSDFGIWNSNKFTASDQSVVPEPSASLLLACGLLVLYCRPVPVKQSRP